MKDLLHAIGFEETEVTGKTGDGVDATGILNVSNLAKVRVFVQAKRYKVALKSMQESLDNFAWQFHLVGKVLITTADYQPRL